MPNNLVIFLKEIGCTQVVVYLDEDAQKDAIILQQKLIEKGFMVKNVVSIETDAGDNTIEENTKLINDAILMKNKVDIVIEPLKNK